MGGNSLMRGRYLFNGNEQEQYDRSFSPVWALLTGDHHLADLAARVTPAHAGHPPDHSAFFQLHIALQGWRSPRG